MLGKSLDWGWLNTERDGKRKTVKKKNLSETVK